MKTPEEIAQLLFRHACHELSPEEELELAEWRAMSAENEQVFRDANDPDYIRREMQFIHETRDRVYKKIMEQSPFPDAVSKIVRPRYYKLLRIAAIIVISLGSLYLVFNIDIGGTPHTVQHKTNYQATFVNPEGVAIALDDMQRGFADGSADAKRWRKANEEPFFTATNDPKAAADKYSTLRTPAGAQYGLILPDGSRVWLNDSSSVKYPARFAIDSPKIAITGEVYLELTTNKSAFSPFYVTVGNMQLTATEGRFNIQANTADTVIVTAIGGTLRLATGSTVLLLYPHEQLRSIRDRLTVLKDVDIHNIIAWKINGGKP